MPQVPAATISVDAGPRQSLKRRRPKCENKQYQSCAQLKWLSHDLVTYWLWFLPKMYDFGDIRVVIKSGQEFEFFQIFPDFSSGCPIWMLFGESHFLRRPHIDKIRVKINHSLEWNIAIIKNFGEWVHAWVWNKHHLFRLKQSGSCSV